MGFMMKIRYMLTLFLSIIVLSGSAHALSTTSHLYLFLSQYINQSVIGSSSFANATINTSSYSIMQISSYQYIVINTTKSQYSFVEDNNTSYLVLKPYLLANLQPNETDVLELNASMNIFRSSGQTLLSQCITVTGLDHLTCTLANECQSCEAVPICNDYLKETDGPTGPVGEGVMNFSIHYNQLNSSYNEYFSLASSLNASNAAAKLAELSGITDNISSESTEISENPLFPPPANFTASEAASCINYNPNSAPWYCYSIGLCQVPNFNRTALSNAQVAIYSLQSLSLSNSSIQSIADNATTNANIYLGPAVITEFSSIEQRFYPQYNSTTKNASALLGFYYNKSLAESLTVLQNTFSELLAHSTQMNITQYNATIAVQLQNVSSMYSSLYSSYKQIIDLSSNNSVGITLHEIDYREQPASLSRIAAEQQSINTQLNSGINSTQGSSIYQNESAIKGSLGFIAPSTVGSFIKSADGGFIGSILSGSNASIPAKLSAAPLYALIVSLIISIIVIVIVYFTTYHRFKRKRRLHLHRKAKRAWLALFLAIVVILAIYSISTYAYASAANSFLPASSFFNSVKSHTIVFIAMNGSAMSNQSLINCESALSQILTSKNKTVKEVDIQNYSCVSSGTFDEPCYDQMLSSDNPIIVISQGKANQIVYKGLYGYTLYASGLPATGSSCLLGKLFEVN